VGGSVGWVGVVIVKPARPGGPENQLSVAETLQRCQLSGLFYRYTRALTLRLRNGSKVQVTPAAAGSSHKPSFAGQPSQSTELGSFFPSILTKKITIIRGSKCNRPKANNNYYQTCKRD